MYKRQAVENACKGRGDDAGNTALLNGDGSMLTGGAAAEIRLADHDITLLNVMNKVFVDILHTVGGQLLVVGDVEVPRRDDDVGINIVAVFMNGSMCFHW